MCTCMYAHLDVEFTNRGCEYVYSGVEDIVVGVTKMGNIVPRAGIEPASRTFRASVLPLHHLRFPDVTTILMRTCLFGS